jgi:uncharacterized protein YkwD
MARMLALIVIFALLLALILLLPSLFPAKAPVKADGTGQGVKPPSQNTSMPTSQPPDIAKPKPAPSPFYNLTAMESKIHNLINVERLRNGLKPLKYNADLAGVAREHSINLARENENLTDPNIYCPDIFIHHEGFDFGLYQDARLENRSIYYFNASGENIFMISGWDYEYADAAYAPCDPGIRIVEEYESPELVLQDLQEHEAYAKTAKRVNWTYIDWVNQSALESQIVKGWMESPGHRANILEPSFDEEGIGVAKINDYLIVTEVFIERTDCGYKGVQCCIEGDFGYCYEPWDCTGAGCE